MSKACRKCRDKGDTSKKKTIKSEPPRTVQYAKIAPEEQPDTYPDVEPDLSQNMLPSTLRGTTGGMIRVFEAAEVDDSRSVDRSKRCVYACDA